MLARALYFTCKYGLCFKAAEIKLLFVGWAAICLLEEAAGGGRVGRVKGEEDLKLFPREGQRLSPRERERERKKRCLFPTLNSFAAALSKLSIGGGDQNLSLFVVCQGRAKQKKTKTNMEEREIKKFGNFCLLETREDVCVELLLKTTCLLASPCKSPKS